MTWKERRTISMLLAIAAALFIALLIVFGIRYRAGRQEVLASANDQIPSGLADVAAISDPGAYVSLSYTRGERTLSFALDEDGNWTWADGLDFPLNDATVLAILDALSSLRFQQVLPVTDTLESYGMDRPSASLTARVASGDEQTLSFGKTTTDGDSYYMMMDGNDTTVYIVSDALVRLLDQPIYDMCLLPTLPDLREANLKALTIQGSAPEEAQDAAGLQEEQPPSQPQRPTVSLTARAAGGENQSVVWFSGSDNVTASPLMQDLLHDLMTLSFTKCVDYYPSDEALEICGFDNPDAILTAQYAAEGLDSLFTLEIGAQMPDETGRYARLDGQGALSALPADTADAIVAIAASGIRGAAQS